MFKFFKEWYDSHLTDPNQVALALIILSISLITYILLATVTPILVAIILAYMLEGLVHRFSENYSLKRNTIVLLVYFSFIAISMIILFLILPLMIDQFTLFVKSLPSILEKGKTLLLNFTSSDKTLITESQLTNIFSALNTEIYNMYGSIVSYSLSSAGSIIETIIYMLIVPILIFFLLFDKEEINGWFKKFFPEKLDLSKKAYAELDLKIGNYIRCKFIEIIIDWVASTLFFTMIGFSFIGFSFVLVKAMLYMTGLFL